VLADWIIGAVVLTLILLSVSIHVPKTGDRKCAQQLCILQPKWITGALFPWLAIW